MTDPRAELSKRQDGFPSGDERVIQTLARYLDLRDGDSSSLAFGISLQIAGDIIEGETEPGAILDSITLAERFGTSRTPIREALFSLEHAGLISTQARRRPRVVAPALEQVIEIYELRAELHALIALKVVDRASDTQLEDLGLQLTQMQNAANDNDDARFFWANVGFHDLMMEVAADSTLRRTIEGLGIQVLRLRRQGVSVPGRMTRALIDNERLLLAFLDRDRDLAGALARSLILRALDGLRTVLKAPEAPDPASARRKRR